MEIIDNTAAVGTLKVESREPKAALYPASHYGAILRKKLDPKIFKPAPSQLLFFIAHMGIILASLGTLIFLDVSWMVKLPISLIMGFSFGMLGFIGHEVMHGSVTRNPFLQNVIAFFCLTPYMGSPTFWKFWHNKLHHGNTQRLIEDPDAFPTLRIYKHSKFMKFMFPFTPGAGTIRSYAYFFFWFSFNFIVAQTYFRFRNKIYQGIEHKKVNKEFAIQVCIYVGTIAASVYFGGAQNLFWVWLLPYCVQNYSVMSYVSTNHNLSPLTNVNDPLINSVTVTNHPILEFLHLNFGYHVEHHLFPTVSSKHVKSVHKEIKTLWPEKFQVVPKWKAVVDLYKTPRIYKNTSTLINPRSLETFPVKNYSNL